MTAATSIGNTHETGAKYAVSIGLFCTIGALFGAVALATPYWFEYDTDMLHLRRGFFEECRITGGERSNTQCSYLEFPDRFCMYDASLVKMRIGWAATLCLLGCLFMAATGILVMGGWCYYRVYSYSALWLSLLAGCMYCGGITLIVHVYGEWYFCNMSFCAYVEKYLAAGPRCIASYGYSFACAIVCVSCSLLSALAAAFYIRAVRSGRIEERHEVPEHTHMTTHFEFHDVNNARGVDVVDDTTGMRKMLPAGSPRSYGFEEVSPARRRQAGQAARFRGSQGSSSGLAAAPGRNSERQMTPGRRQKGGNRPPTASGPMGNRQSSTSSFVAQQSSSSLGGPGLPGNMRFPSNQRIASDWVWRADCQLYWSESEGLFLHPSTQHFYDPSSERWYDPRAQRWY